MILRVQVLPTEIPRKPRVCGDDPTAVPMIRNLETKGGKPRVCGDDPRLAAPLAVVLG